MGESRLPDTRGHGGTFRVVAAYGGARREATGTIQLAEFLPIVVEFELRPTGPDGTLTLVQEGQ